MKDMILQIIKQEANKIDSIGYEIVGNEIVASEEVGDGYIIWHINYSVSSNGNITYILREEWDGVDGTNDVEDEIYKCDSIQELIEMHIRPNKIDMEHLNNVYSENVDLAMENIKLKLEIDGMLGYSKYCPVIKR